MEPGRYISIKCAVCESCHFDIKTNCCVCGGPYDGYTEIIPIPKINPQFSGIKCHICALPYEDDKYKRDIDYGFPLYYDKGDGNLESYIQFCSCECGTKWHKENTYV